MKWCNKLTKNLKFSIIGNCFHKIFGYGNKCHFIRNFNLIYFKYILREEYFRLLGVNGAGNVNFENADWRLTNFQWRRLDQRNQLKVEPKKGLQAHWILFPIQCRARRIY